jgi:hypothetical protein
MEPVSLITAALALATPYLLKTGEKVAEGIGEDIWKLIKRPFTGSEERALNKNVAIPLERDELIAVLLDKVNSDSVFKSQLQEAVNKGQEDLNAYSQQNINNHGRIDKQVNVQIINGNVTL